MVEMLDALLLNRSHFAETRARMVVGLRGLHFERDELGFPPFSYGTQPDDADDALWSTFFANNVPRDAPPFDEYHQRMGQWVDGGGVKRLMQAVMAQRQAGASRVKSSY